MRPQRVTLHFQTEPLLMRVVREQTAAAATAFGATPVEAGRVELAVGEALSNAHRHGYNGTPGPVELEITYASGARGPGELGIEYLRPWLAVTVRDQGRGFPDGPAFPEPPDARTGDGYGLQVIKDIMDEAEFDYSGSPEGGTTLRMTIFLQ